MITPEMIARINALAKKKKTIGLTEQEQTEQAELYRFYLDHIKHQLKGTLERIEFVDAPIEKEEEAAESAPRRMH